MEGKKKIFHETMSNRLIATLIISICNSSSTVMYRLATIYRTADGGVGASGQREKHNTTESHERVYLFSFWLLFELENSPREFSSMGNLVTGWKNKNYIYIYKKEYFGLNSFSTSDVSLGIAFVVLEVLIATSLQYNLLAGAIIGVGDCKRGLHAVPSK